MGDLFDVFGMLMYDILHESYSRVGYHALWNKFVDMCRDVAACNNEDDIWPVLLKFLSDSQKDTVELARLIKAERRES